MKKKLVLRVLFLFALTIASAGASGSSGFECHHEMKTRRTIVGKRVISLKMFTMNEICYDESEAECRASLSEALEEDRDYRQEVTQTFLDAGIHQFSRILRYGPVSTIINLLMSEKKVVFTVDEHTSFDWSDEGFLKYIPIGSKVEYTDEYLKEHAFLKSEENYRLYTNQAFYEGKEKSMKFRKSLGGGLTDNLEEILTSEPGANFSAVNVHEWFVGDFQSPLIYSSIVGNQMVLTFQRSLGEVDSLSIYPIPLDQALDIPFQFQKVMKGLNVKVDSHFKVECHQL